MNRLSIAVMWGELYVECIRLTPRPTELEAYSSPAAADPKILLSRALGLANCDFREDPFSEFTRLCSPNTQTLWAECRRRFEIFQIKMNKGNRNNYPGAKTPRYSLVQWLEKYPIVDAGEVKELQGAVEKLRCELYKFPRPYPRSLKQPKSRRIKPQVLDGRRVRNKVSQIAGLNRGLQHLAIEKAPKKLKHGKGSTSVVGNSPGQNKKNSKKEKSSARQKTGLNQRSHNIGNPKAIDSSSDCSKLENSSPEREPSDLSLLKECKRRYKYLKIGNSDLAPVPDTLNREDLLMWLKEHQILGGDEGTYATYEKGLLHDDVGSFPASSNGGRATNSVEEAKDDARISSPTEESTSDGGGDDDDDMSYVTTASGETVKQGSTTKQGNLDGTHRKRRRSPRHAAEDSASQISDEETAAVALMNLPGRAPPTSNSDSLMKDSTMQSGDANEVLNATNFLPKSFEELNEMVRATEEFGSLHMESEDYCRYRDRAGLEYHGQWVTNRKIASGRRYDGMLSDGKPIGFGKCRSHSDAWWHAGEYKNGLRDGYGLYQTSEKESYKGEWKNGVRHGYGHNMWPDDVWYKGEYRDGLRHGHGTYVGKKGMFYEGGFAKDMFEGQGKLMSARGTIIMDAEWHENKPVKPNPMPPSVRSKRRKKRSSSNK